MNTYTTPTTASTTSTTANKITNTTSLSAQSKPMELLQTATFKKKNHTFTWGFTFTAKEGRGVPK